MAFPFIGQYLNETTRMSVEDSRNRERSAGTSVPGPAGALLRCRVRLRLLPEEAIA